MLCAACCVLIGVFAVVRSLFRVACLLLVGGRCALFVVCWLMVAGCCVLFVVWRVLIDV